MVSVCKTLILPRPFNAKRVERGAQDGSQQHQMQIEKDATPEQIERIQASCIAWLNEWPTKKDDNKFQLIAPPPSCELEITDSELVHFGLINTICPHAFELEPALKVLVEKELVTVACAQKFLQRPRDVMTVYKLRFRDLAKSLAKLSSRYSHEFEEISELGQGCAGVVRLCKNRRDGHRYAVKMIDIEARTAEESEEDYHERLKFIEREAKTLADMKCEYVVRYYQSWYEDASEALGLDPRRSVNTEKVFCIQMEYCGSSLESRLDKGDIHDKLSVFKQVVRGLEYVHSRNIIHRDLCPKNVFVDRHNAVKIGDFGLAKHHGGCSGPKLSFSWSTSTQSHTTEVGTEHYAAPEVSETSRFDKKADIYSLGVIYFDICNGKRQGSARDVYQVLKKGQLPASFTAAFPRESALIADMIQVVPEKRPSTKEILDRLAV